MNSCRHLEMLIVIILAAAFSIVSLTLRNVPQSFQTRQAVADHLANQVFLPANASSPVKLLEFHSIQTEQDMWAWINGPFRAQMTIPSYNLSSLFNSSLPLVPTSSAQLAQLRVGSSSCSVAPQLAGVAKVPALVFFVHVHPSLSSLSLSDDH